MKKTKMHMNKKKILSTAISVLVSTLLVAGVVFAVTTIGTDISTDGNLTVSGTAAFNGAALTDGVGVVSSGYIGVLGVGVGYVLTPQEATYGVCGSVPVSETVGDYYGSCLGYYATTTDAMYGLAIFNPTAETVTDIILQNGETIDNATDGLVTVGGKVLINGAEVDATSGYEQFLKVTGNVTGVGAGGVGSKTWIINVDATRPASANVTVGDSNDMGLKMSMTNQSTSNAAGYYMRGADIQVKNDSSAKLTHMEGLYVTAYNKNESSGTVDSATAAQFNMKNSGIIDTSHYGVVIQDQSMGTNPSDTVMLKLDTSSDAVGTRTGIKFTTSGTGYGTAIDMNGATITTDLKLQNGETIDNDTDNSVKITSPAIVQAYDAAAYWTATQADAGGVTFDSTSDGTPSFTFNDETAISFSTAAANKTAFTVTANQITTASTDQLKGALIQAKNMVDGNAKTITGIEVKANGQQSEAAVGTKITDILRGAYLHADAKDQDVATQRGLEIDISGGGYVGGGTADMVQGIYIANNRLSGTSQTEAYGIYLSPGDKGFTADIRLSSGALIVTGSGAPSGACTAGSLYLNTATTGGTYATYQCKTTTWTGIGAAY